MRVASPGVDVESFQSIQNRFIENGLIKPYFDHRKLSQIMSMAR